MRWLLVIGGVALAGAIGACALDDDGKETVPPSTSPVCGNAITEAGEDCDRYADPLTWACSLTQGCAADCTCGGEGGAGGTGQGGEAGSGGVGGDGAGLPVGGDGDPSCEAPSGEEGPLALVPIVAGLVKPVLAIAPTGEENRLYIVEQTGTIILYEDGEKKVFLDITDELVCCGERGFLGLAFHPDYAANGRFFVHYSAAGGGDTAIAEYARDPSDHDKALPDAVGGSPFFTARQPASNHNGGSIHFSPMDGHLYVFLGDGGGGGDTFMNGQNLASNLGKVLRIDVEQSPPAAAGNYPGADPFNWDIGLRNPWRTSFDTCTGDLYIGDVGQNAIEEIDVEPAGMGNRNYGWNIMEGSVCFNPPSDCDTTGLTLPAVVYEQVDGNCSVTGGYVYRGDLVPWLRGTYFYADYCSGRVWTFVWDGTAATAQADRSADLVSTDHQISSFGQDASGEVYVMSYSEGLVLRIESEPAGEDRRR
jgi:glucose/arabinose dehydrogenase